MITSHFFISIVSNCQCETCHTEMTTFFFIDMKVYYCVGQKQGAMLQHAWNTLRLSALLKGITACVRGKAGTCSSSVQVLHPAWNPPCSWHTSEPAEPLQCSAFVISLIKKATDCTVGIYVIIIDISHWLNPASGNKVENRFISIFYNFSQNLKYKLCKNILCFYVSTCTR